MKNYRNNVFETNSSSCHTITLDTSAEYNNKLCVQKSDNKVHVELKYFERGYYKYTNVSDKLAYMILQASYIENISISVHHIEQWEFENKPTEEELEKRFLKNCSELYETKTFQKIVKAVQKRYPCCKGIVIDYSYGSIDHESVARCESIEEWLSDNDLNSIDDFLFGNYILETDEG